MYAWRYKIQLMFFLFKILLKLSSQFMNNERLDATQSSTILLTMLREEKKRQTSHNSFLHKRKQHENKRQTQQKTHRENVEHSLYKIDTDAKIRTSIEKKMQTLQNPYIKNKNQRTTKENSVAYFSGNEIIRFAKNNLNLHQFTIEFWISVEGGQMDGVDILRIHNHCSLVDLSSVTIGMKEYIPNKDLRIFFQLRTVGMQKFTTVWSHSRVNVLEWTYVSAVYDGANMTLYINQAKVGVSLEQYGMFLSNVFPKCTTLEVGGHSQNYTTFRGYMDSLKILNVSKNHREITYSMEGRNVDNTKYTVLNEQFNLPSRVRNYYSVTGVLPDLVYKEIQIKENGNQLKIPVCGQTICDIPDIIKNYMAHPNIYMKKKVIRYRVVVLANSDGGNLILNKTTIMQKHAKINEIFKPYHISFKIDIKVFRSSYLRNKTVLVQCNNHCTKKIECYQPPECNRYCSKKKLGNDICDPECNDSEYGHNWDGGDCCNPLYTNISETCFDPNSPNLAFITEEELKGRINLSNQDILNILPVKLPKSTAFLGKSTYPWEGEVYTSSGGIVINIRSFEEALHDVIHEMGHVFGLLHVHRGVSEIHTCNNACAETHPSMTTGDLCSDTNPTPRNYKCIGKVNQTDECGFKVYKDTPYRNFMGYGSENCSSEFTRQQMARMHCYIDKAYQRWRANSDAPSAIPLPPKVTRSSRMQNMVEISWHEPVGYESFDQQSCLTSTSEIKQFVNEAFYIDVNGYKQTVKQVAGPPDAVPCIYDKFKAWYSSQAIEGNRPGFYLEVQFKKTAIPIALKLWVTKHGRNSINDIVLINEDNTTDSLGPATAHCDVPFTRRIKTHKSCRRIRLYVSRRKGILRRPAIDAAELISREIKFQHADCRRKVQLRYQVYRLPPFKGKQKQPIIVKERKFIDTNVEVHITYTYKVQAITNKQVSQPSPPLIFRLVDGYCGNGLVEKQQGEECDDGNHRYGDGCSEECRIEAVFSCQYQPSLCYRYDNDGICKESERSEGTRDCTFSTPRGYRDHWCTHVIGMDGQSDSQCPEQVIAGKPPDNIKCTLFSGYKNFDFSTAWLPCNAIHPVTGEFLEWGWIEASFAVSVVVEAIVLYLASDGRWNIQAENYTINAKLKDINKNYYPVGRSPTIVNCRNNPTVIKINYPRHQNGSTIKFLSNVVRIEFKIGYLAITGIAIRSKDRDCILEKEVYSDETKACEFGNKHFLSPSCSPLKIGNGVVKCFNNNTKCDVICNQGYVPKMPYSTYCVNGSWYHLKRCRPVICEELKVENAISDCQNKTFGSSCSFSCKDGSYLHGDTTNVTCLSDGRWSKQMGYCYRTCANRPHVENATLEQRSCATTVRSGDKYEMGTRCRLRCKKGYQPSRRGKYATITKGHLVNVHCNGSGQWINDSYCELKKCPAVSRYHSLMFNCTNTNHYKSFCRTTCLGTKSLHTTICQADGTWSKSFDVCKAKVDCGKFPNLVGVDARICSSTSLGSMCKPVCKQLNMDIVQKGADGSRFINEDVVFYCMPNSQWLPNPENVLSCEIKCDTRLMNNGRCDCDNNRVHCFYDNGACCSNHVEFVHGRRCKCIDPKYVANELST